MKRIFNDTQIAGELCIIKEMLAPVGLHNAGTEVPHARILRRVIALEKRLLELHEKYELSEK